MKRTRRGKRRERKEIDEEERREINTETEVLKDTSRERGRKRKEK